MKIAVFTWNLQVYNHKKAVLSKHVVEHIMRALFGHAATGMPFIGTLLEIKAPRRKDTRPYSEESIEKIVKALQDEFQSHEFKIIPRIKAIDCGGLPNTREWILVIYSGFSDVSIESLGFRKKIAHLIKAENLKAILKAGQRTYRPRQTYHTHGLADIMPNKNHFEKMDTFRIDLKKDPMKTAKEASRQSKLLHQGDAFDEDGDLPLLKQFRGETTGIYTSDGSDYSLNIEAIKKRGTKIANQDENWYRDGCLIKAKAVDSKGEYRISVVSIHLPGPNHTARDGNILNTFKVVGFRSNPDILIGDLNTHTEVIRELYRDLSTELSTGTTLKFNSAIDFGKTKYDRAILRTTSIWKHHSIAITAAEEISSRPGKIQPIRYERVSDHGMLTVVLHDGGS
ncbi:hypothetical protein [Rhizobium mayense]|uniref:hypothetical protein n=1 Tax=Rhizobium mayense TaxID=1312184 RepID=UPI00398C4125